MHTNWQLEMARRMFLFFSFFIVFPFARTIHSQLQLGNNHKYNRFLFFILFLISIFPMSVLIVFTWSLWNLLNVGWSVIKLLGLSYPYANLNGTSILESQGPVQLHYHLFCCGTRLVHKAKIRH